MHLCYHFIRSSRAALSSPLSLTHTHRRGSGHSGGEGEAHQSLQTTCIIALPRPEPALLGPTASVTWEGQGKTFSQQLSDQQHTDGKVRVWWSPPAYALLFMKTLSMDLVSSQQSSRGTCLFKSISSQVKFVALMNGRAESSIKGQRKITFIC